MLPAVIKFLQLKRYQYEVTFSLYMLTPAEKFVFNTIVFFVFSMLILACSMYLPRHVSFILSRAWFYYAGDEVVLSAPSALASSSKAAADFAAEL